MLNSCQKLSRGFVTGDTMMSRSVLALAFCFAIAHSSVLGAQPARAPIDTTWRQGGTCYEIFVRSFFDSDGDGIGDLTGLTQKLDYVNDGNPRSTRSLGAKCIWLMPIDASPSYHGYDVKNYYRVNPEYGTTADFKRLVAAAHRRGIRVLVDLVLNHASSEHPYFKEALHDPASPHRSWFRFAPTPPAERGPWGQQVWHKSPERNEYYYGIFTAEMPDLNYATPEVRAEAARVGRFWLTEMGVDGFRLDAVPYLVEENGALAGTAGTHAVLREFAASVQRTVPGAFTVGEVWDSIGTVMTYYPDQLDSYFAFELSDKLLDAVRTSTAQRMLDAYARMQRAMPATRWSPFQRNHDQTRTVTALGGDLRAARLSAELLLTLPGLPFVYYGEELGMTGDKPDPRLRTPMHWATGRAAGFTTGAAWEPLQPDSATANVAVQNADPASLLNHYRRLIHLRSANRALGAGDFLPLESSDPAVAAFLRRDGPRAVLVVANLATTPRAGVTLSSGDGALGRARYATRDLLGEGATSALVVEADGRIRAYVPRATLDARRTYVLELTRAAR
jgi:glycosidase